MKVCRWRREAIGSDCPCVLNFGVINGTLKGMILNFTAYIEKDPESGMYVGTVPTLPGAHTFAETIDDLRSKLVEVVTLCLEEIDQDEITTLPVFTGITQVEVAV